MYNFFSVNDAEYPASQSWPMERSDPEAKCGNICVVFADGGRCGMSSCPMCVDLMYWLFGRQTSMPCCTDLIFVIGIVQCMYWSGSFSSKKWLVAPVSAMMQCELWWDDTEFKNWILFLFSLLLKNSVLPPRHLRDFCTSCDPPIRLSHDDYSLCPSALLVHVLLLWLRLVVTPCV